MSKSSDQLKARGRKTLGFAKRYSIAFLLLFLIGIYGFLALRAVSLERSQPDPAAVSSQLKTASVPHVDSQVVDKIQQLQDNSVSVQTLFDQARTSPFQE